MTVAWDAKSEYDVAREPYFDCSIAEYLLIEGRQTPEYEKTLNKYTCTSIEALANKQQELLAHWPKVAMLMNQIEMPLIPVLSAMERQGIRLDRDKLRSIGQDLDTEIETIRTDLQREVGYEINLNSSIQVGEFIATTLNVPLSKTKTGKYATGEQELVGYQESVPFIKSLLSYREKTKLRSTYIDSLIDKVGPDGRIHTTYSQIVASTGRLSSSNPNLQNIPVASEYAKKIKSCFIPEEGNVFVSFDYSQQELRILAHLCGEKTLTTAFTTNEDIHTVTASKLFGIPYTEVTKEQRSIAKTINFGIIYGMGSFGMSAQLGISVEEAQRFIDTFYSNYPNIKQYFDSYLKQAQLNGYAETMLGRRRYVFSYPGQKFIDNATRRVLTNFPIQGSAADLMKMAMIAVHQKICIQNPGCHLLLQIHDELVFEIPKALVDQSTIIQEIRNVLCTTYPLSVPVEVQARIGNTWGDLSTIM